MPAAYPDPNALIALGVKARNADFRKKLDSSLESGALSVVVSTWHLIEIANTKNVGSPQMCTPSAGQAESILW